MTLGEYAHKMRKLIVKSAANLTDKDVSEAPCMCTNVKEITTPNIDGGTRINWNGTVMRATVTMQNIPSNYPDQAPVLWESIGYKDGFRIIPEVITPGLKFGQGEKGWWKDKLYESKIDNNTWTPETNPEFWKEI